MKQLGLFAVIMLLCGVLFGCTAVKSRDASGTESAPTAEVLQPTEEAPSSDPAVQPVTETPTEEPEKSTEIDDPTDEPISEKPEYPYLDIEDVLSSPVSPYAAHVFSHQGTAKEECSETFAAYDLAILYGSRCLEQDLVISSDGILYCSHDLSPERLTGEQRQFSEMTSREIDALRTETGNLCIPRLSAVFARYGKAVTYVIELRPGEEILQRFLELVSEYEMQDNVILQSSELDVLQRIEEIYPDMPKLFLSFNKDQLALALQADHVDIIAVSGGLFTQAYCDQVHAAGKEYCVYVVNATSSIRKAIEMGVDYYFTDFTGKAFTLEALYR